MEVCGGGLAGVRALQRAKTGPPAVSVYAWGRGSEGQLMLAEAETPRGVALADACAPSIVERLTRRAAHNAVVDLAGGMWSTTFAVTMSGVVFASGSNEERELHPTVDTDTVAHPHIMASLDAHHVLQIAAGASHCVAITANRKVLTWGSSNNFGELGRGDRARAATAANTCTALPLFGLSRYRAVQVSCGMHYTLTLTARGVLFSCGSGAHGCLGHGDVEHRAAATPIRGALTCVPVASISAGGQHCGCVTAGGSAFAWGRARHGRLGLGELDALACDVKDGIVMRPTAVAALRRYGAVAQVACGHEHTAWLLASAPNERGDGADDDPSAPHRALDSDSDASEEEEEEEGEEDDPPAAAGAGRGSAALASRAAPRAAAATQFSGAIFTAGNNRSGQLGACPDRVACAFVPRFVASLPPGRFTQVSCGHEHTICLHANGEVWAVGSNACSQLGGAAGPAGTPFCALQGERAFRVLACGDHSMALVAPATDPRRAQYFQMTTTPSPPLTTKRLLEAVKTRDFVRIKPLLDEAFGSLAELSMCFRDRRVVARARSAFHAEAPCRGAVQSDVLDVRGLGDAYAMILASQSSVALLRHHIQALAAEFRDVAASLAEVEAMRTVPLALLQCPLLVDPTFSLALVNIAVGVQRLRPALREALVAQLSQRAIVPRALFERCLVAPLRSFIDTNLILTKLQRFGGELENLTGAIGSDPSFAVPELLGLLHRASARGRVQCGRAQAPPRAFHATVLTSMSNAELREELTVWRGRGPGAASGAAGAGAAEATDAKTSLLAYPFLVDVLTKRRLVHEEAIYGMGAEAAASIAQSFGLDLATVAAGGGFADAGSTAAVQLHELGVALARAPGIPTLRDIGFAPLLGNAGPVGGGGHSSSGVDDLTSPYFVVRIKRSELLQSALHIVSSASPHMLRKPLRVAFEGEPASDAGGVRRDFFASLVASIFRVEFGMFSWLPRVRAWWFAPAELGAVAGDYFVVGAVLALALYNHVMVELRLPREIYAALLRDDDGDGGGDGAVGAGAAEGGGGKPLRLVERLAALRDVLPELASTLSDILLQAEAFNCARRRRGFEREARARGAVEGAGVEGEEEEEEEEEDPIAEMCIAFETQVESTSGALHTHELVPGGTTIAVTSRNAMRFVSCYVEWVMRGSVRAQLDALRRGFRVVLGTSVLSLLDADDLELLLCGTPELDFKALREAAKFVGWEDSHTAHAGAAGGEEEGDDERPTQEAPALRHFWDAVDSLSAKQQRQLLRFATGCDRAPIGGLAELVLTIQRDGCDPARLPTASTCHRTLLLPDYGDNAARVRERLVTAIAYCGSGFGLI